MSQTHTKKKDEKIVFLSTAHSTERSEHETTKREGNKTAHTIVSCLETLASTVN